MKMMTKNNMIIRSALLRYNVRTWQLAADVLKVSEPTVYRMLRQELPEEEQKEIAAKIEQYAARSAE